jgi:hypothetical protein
MVIAGFGTGAREEKLEAGLGFRPMAVIDGLVALVRRAILNGVAGDMAFEPRTVATLMAVEELSRLRIADHEPMHAVARGEGA